MTDLISCLCLLLFFIQMCLFLHFAGYGSKVRTRMAALIAWLVGSVTGSRAEEEQTEKNNQETIKEKPKTEAKQNKSKVKQRGKKVNEEPTFNTKLSTPIEDIIEETLSEEKTDSQPSTYQNLTTEKPVAKPKKKKKSVKKDKSENKSDEEDNIGFSFFNQKSTLPNPKGNKQTLETHIETKVSRENSVDDNVGFSFFSVKERTRKGKGKSLLEKHNSEDAISAVIAHGIAKRSDSSKPSIIDHYKNRDIPVKKTHITENSQSYVFVNKVDTNLIKTDPKESKKVTSHISFASIVTNAIPGQLIVESQDNLNKEASSSIEVLSQCSEDLEVNTELAEEVSETTLEVNNSSYIELSTPVKQSDLQENLAQSEQPEYSTWKSESIFESSIEVIEKAVINKQIHKDSNSHFTDNVLNSVNHSENNQSNSCVEINFEHTQSEQIGDINKIQEVSEQAVNSPKHLIEKVGDASDKYSEQALNDIIEQLVHNEDSNIVADKVAQEDIKNIEELLIEESRDYLENNLKPQRTNLNFTHLPVQLEEYSLENGKPSEPQQIEAIYDQNNKNLVEEKIVVGENTSNRHIEEPEYFIVGQTVEECIQEHKLSSFDDKYISEIVDDFITAEIEAENQQEINLDPNFYEHQGAQEILAVEQIYIEQESGPKPVEEKPFIKKVSYTTTENQTNDNSTNIVSHVLGHHISKESLNAVPLLNTEEIQINPEDLPLIIADQRLDNQNQTKNQQLTNGVPSEATALEEKAVEIFAKSEEIEKDLISITEIIQDSSSNQIKIDSYQSLTSQIKKTPDYDHPIKESFFTNMAQIRVLTLNDKEHQESTIYRIEKSFILQFRLGPSLLGRKIKLYCNYPKETNGVLKEFDRGTYQFLNWCQDEGCENADDTASFAQIVTKIAGSFHYYFVYENEDTEERQGSGYFLVDPILKYGNDEVLPLDCIQCQTVLAKQLGPFSTWENKLKVSEESGYNVVHFTPIQELGSSKSCYSLSEQLKLNPMFNEENGKKPSFEDVETLTTKMRKEWKVLSICDIVLNHTANESEWIKDHSDATYNCVNCPYMRPAYLLDGALHHFSMDVKKGYYEDRGIPAEVSTEEHLNAIRYHFKTSVLESLKLQELFIVDVNKYLESFLTLARKTPPTGENERDNLGEITVIQDPEFRRLKSTIDLDLALKIFNVYRLDCFDEESRVKRCAEDLKNKLDSLNEVIIKEVSDDLNAAVDNVIAGIKYFRVQADGPKFKDISISRPLVYRYFTDYGSPKSLKEYEELTYSENGRFVMAHNGWVMNSDPLKNFAASGSKIYMRRELIAWSDSVKLRYGDKPEDSPYLWNYMRKYVEQTAKIFDGVRLDNCHSTPIPVAEYLLDAARKIRPDLYVVAELFTNSDLTDNIFVNRLGITSLIREAMSAWDSHEEGRLVYRYGGVPVGSFFQPSVRPLVPMVAHALFLDLTHDNPSPIEKRSVFDLLPSTALVNMACCASGSTRGYDELVPHHVHVVDETRQYTEWSVDESLVVGNVKYVNDKFGIIAAKKALNELHFKLGKEGYNQVYVDQMDPDIVAVTRHNPETHTSYVLVAFTAFGHPEIHAGDYQRGIKPLRVEGVLDEIVLEASLSHIDAISSGSRFTKFEAFTKDSTWINGLAEYQVSLKQHIQVAQSDIFEDGNSGAENVFQLNFKNFKPGSVAVVRISLPEDIKESVSKVRTLISNFSIKKDTDLRQIISRLSLADLNRTLYRCDQEERDEGNGFEAYNIPNFGPMVYCGLQGFMSLLANIRPNNDLGHPFCANLRDGNWLIEYVWKRLKVDDGTKELGQWIEENTKYLHSIPRYLIPCYFDVIVTGIYVNLLKHSDSLMCDFVKNGSTFVRSLSLGSLQFGGYVKSANLPVLSPNLAPPKPPTRKNKNGETVQACITLSAGLPHFSVGYMRNWGRDTFIALRGLLILTGRFEESRQHILGYAACLRHGLIPNLLDGGKNSRFNCRDAIWWWLYCIKSYCEESPNGMAILLDKVSRIFPTDDSAPQLPGAVDQPLHDVIQEALKVHFQGLKFRERNAGRQIDEQMTDTGFNNQIGIHPETGFVFGGNQWNCGTWMDKMGSSDKAGNKGKPATPRDGSAVELVGLSKAAISWLWKLNQEGKYPYDGIERTHKNGAVTKWTFKEWSDKIQDSFEKKFWVGPKPSSDESRPDLVNKKNIYKDTFGASQPWTDFQLRPNFPIAMVAAPEIFDPQHAWAALEQAEKYLLGPLGMKTLDPEDWNYRGDYDNSNDSNDFNLSHGFNYHQGPEWVWPIGFFLRAKLLFAAQNGMLQETVASTKVILSKHFTELQTSPWRGLPELTNSNGSYCGDSSRTQAWSMSCILEVLHDLQQIEAKQIIVN